MNHRLALALPAASLIALLAACAGGPTRAPAVPQELQPPPSQVLTLVTRATGVQVYTCSPAKDNPARFGWSFTAPEAGLFDASGRKIGKHYAGPTWEADDGSKVVGTVQARNDGADAQAIPWLLLAAQAAPAPGLLSGTTHIQRLATVGGKAPAAGCDAARAGQVSRVPYEATYYFFGAKR